MTQNLRIVQSRFIASASDISNAPDPSVSEIVFLGRSNVGKSSLLNALCARKNLAKISATPGKTRLINFYEIKAAFSATPIVFRFVDLPGFGYAKASKSERGSWEKNLTPFLQNRVSIRLFLRLIDSRLDDLPQDIITKEFVGAIIKADQKDCAVYTKADKLNRKEKDALLRKDQNALLISSKSGEGLDRLLHIIIDSIAEQKV
ncbi:MAG: ribosome biogenesis GTP-binding protein YihA/YsxC [Helicobacteraceae bacterium]|jgi:GTP-binding protein|nr:ribosome biogenesis GTP-binding protein YihA/YsxC [Helicobacteraceae bacterium]